MEAAVTAAKRSFSASSFSRAFGSTPSATDGALLFLGGQKLRGALGAGEQVLAVFRSDEGGQRLDAAGDHQQVVGFRRQHGVDQVVAGAVIAEIDFQAVVEEGEEIDVLGRRQQRQPNLALQQNSDDTQSRTAQCIGSFEPVGFSSIAQKPISVSSLSASATVIATLSSGTRSDGPCGL